MTIVFSNSKISNELKVLLLQIRPDAANGLWLMFLLPAAMIISSVKHPVITTHTYILATILSIGIICTSFLFFLRIKYQKLTKTFQLWLLLTFSLTSSIFYIFLGRGILFSMCSGISSTIIYFELYLLVMNKFPKCFSLGEGALVTQSILIVLYITLTNLFTVCSHLPVTKTIQSSTLIIQMGLLGLGSLTAILFKMKIRSSSSFYMATFIALLLVTMIPLHVLLGRSPVLWILNLVIGNSSTLKMFLYWSVCCCLAVLAINYQIISGQKASSSIRKIFHLLAIAIFLPGLLYECSFLYLASGIVFGLFLAVEIVRILDIPPLGKTLQEGFLVFRDDKDAGILALTPIYLLAGCSIPLWLHPAPCDVTDSAYFYLLPLLSGVLTVGIGDAAASIIGSKLGRFHWPGSRKTIEGTIAYILSQVIVLYILIRFDYIKMRDSALIWRTSGSIILTSLVEATTDQVDNLVLPLIMYILLI